MGRVTKWDDKRIAALNPGVKLPNTDLVVVHRSDGSGTTYVFTDFLNKFSREWRDKVGFATSVNWPVGLGGKGNEGVTQQVKQVEGAIGYVELIYALSNNLPFGVVKNSSGAFVEPSLESVTAAAAGVKLKADTDFRVSITNAEGSDCLSDRLVHLAPGPQGHQGCCQGETAEGFPDLDDRPRGPGHGGRAQVCAASQGSRHADRGPVADPQGRRQGHRGPVSGHLLPGVRMAIRSIGSVALLAATRAGLRGR